MTRLLPTLLLLFLGLSMSAQESSTISAQYMVDEDPVFLDLSTMGSEAVWDFTALEASTRIDAGSFQNGEAEIPFIGQVRLDPQGRITDLRTTNLLGGYKRRWTTLSHSLSFDQPYADEVETGYQLIIPADDLESVVLNQLPIIPDSLKITFTAKINDIDSKEVQLIYKGSERTVTYFRRVIEIQRATFVKLEPFGWESVTEIAPMIQWDESYEIEQRFFIDNSIDRPIAIINQDRNGLKTAFLTFKETNPNRASLAPQIKAVPNPVISNLRFEVDNLSPGRYVIKIKNILGQKKMEKIIDYTKPDAIPIDITNLRKGSYFYSLEDSTGSIISTKRLIVLKP